MTSRVGLGFDVHPFGGSGPLVLGGVTIGPEGLDGHSDADAVAHAVCDALLSPAGLPDLGTMYPASDEAYRGAVSMDILRDVVDRVRAAGWSAVNVDVVIAAERPRLGEHLGAIATGVAGAIDAVQGSHGEGVHVSVKAKRGEGLGAIGRGEGVAVWAVALLERL